MPRVLKYFAAEESSVTCLKTIRSESPPESVIAAVESAAPLAFHPRGMAPERPPFPRVKAASERGTWSERRADGPHDARSKAMRNARRMAPVSRIAGSRAAEFSFPASGIVPPRA
jgi:hypothetical protein